MFETISTHQSHTNTAKLDDIGISDRIQATHPSIENGDQSANHHRCIHTHVDNDGQGGS